MSDIETARILFIRLSDTLNETINNLDEELTQEITLTDVMNALSTLVVKYAVENNIDYTDYVERQKYTWDKLTARPKGTTPRLN